MAFLELIWTKYVKARIEPGGLKDSVIRNKCLLPLQVLLSVLLEHSQSVNQELK